MGQSLRFMTGWTKKRCRIRRSPAPFAYTTAVDCQLIDTDPTPDITAFMDGHPHGSLWQSAAWARYQRALGRTVRWAVGRTGSTVMAAALVIEVGAAKRTDWQVPRGPLFAADLPLPEQRAFLAFLRGQAKAARAIALYASPSIELTALSNEGFRPSGRHEQPEATVMLDLALSDEALLAQMKPKGRYNIGVAQRHEVWVEQSRNLPAYVRMARETAQRDGFRGASQKQLETFLDTLEGSFLLLAYPPASIAQTRPGPIAGLLGVLWKGTGIYYYGASSSEHRNLMAPYALQWEAMRLCRRLGAQRYDLLGIAPPDSGDHHPWAGVTDFKRKFGGAVITYPPEQRLVLRPVTHATLALKRRLVG